MCAARLVCFLSCLLIDSRVKRKQWCRLRSRVSIRIKRNVGIFLSLEWSFSRNQLFISSALTTASCQRTRATKSYLSQWIRACISSSHADVTAGCIPSIAFTFDNDKCYIYTITSEQCSSSDDHRRGIIDARWRERKAENWSSTVEIGIAKVKRNDRAITKKWRTNARTVKIIQCSLIERGPLLWRTCHEEGLSEIFLAQLHLSDVLEDSSLCRLAEQAQRQLEKGGKFEDLNQIARPTELIRSYNSLYSQARIDALDALDNIREMSNAEDLKSKLLFSVVVVRPNLISSLPDWNSPRPFSPVSFSSRPTPRQRHSQSNQTDSSIDQR